LKAVWIMQHLLECWLHKEAEHEIAAKLSLEWVDLFLRSLW